jgi:hypothetical protein
MPLIHQDRTLKDTVSFDELQELARRSSESGEEIHWFEKLQKLDPKSDCLVEKSITSSSSDISGTTGIFHSSKRKIAFEVSLQCDSAAKRVNQMGIMESSSRSDY